MRSVPQELVMPWERVYGTHSSDELLATDRFLREGVLMSSAVGLLLSLPGPKETSKAIVTWMTLA